MSEEGVRCSKCNTITEWKTDFDTGRDFRGARLLADMYQCPSCKNLDCIQILLGN